MLTYKRFHTEKRKWNSYPNKNFKTYKVYEIILNIKVGESMIKTSLKLFPFRTLKILWFNCFRLKKSICIVKSVLVVCSVLQCFLLLF